MDDRISNLPDELLCHILSFLRTKKVVASSILSKKWKSLWRSVPTLHFDDYNIERKEDHARFVQSVCAFILSQDQHQLIQNFRLRFSSHGDDSTSHDDDYSISTHISEWLNVAVRRRVLHLDVSLCFLRGFRESTTNLSAIFTCSTLVVLKLRWLNVKLFSTVDLPFLKVLHLNFLTFPKYQCLARLLSGCPVLEDFKARSISFKDYSTHGEFKTLLKLVRADISMANTRYLLTKVVNNVEFLLIREMEHIHYIHDGEGRGGYIFPKFHNLAHIELVYNWPINDWLEVVELLKHCPKLQVLVINQPHSHRDGFDGIEEVGDWKYPSSVPECILLHLNRCYLKDYKGTRGEFQFARYIMQNGRYLKRMTICNSIAVNQQEKLKMLEKLSSFTTSSTTCKLSFE